MTFPDVLIPKTRAPARNRQVVRPPGGSRPRAWTDLGESELTEEQRGERRANDEDVDNPGRAHRRWLEAFVRDHQRRMIVFFARHLGDWAGAEDIVQDSLVKVLRLCAGNPDMAPTEGLMFQIGLNFAKDRWRKAAREGRVFNQLVRRYPGAAPENPASYFATMEVLAGMPALDAHAFLLCKVMRYSSQEVGNMLGLSPSTVRWKTAKAAAVLRQALADSEKDGQGTTNESR